MDRDMVITGAASIIAKVTRDREIEQLKKQIGVNFGSGYPSDKKTRTFLKTLNKADLPAYVRKSWSTWNKI
jgi:ribonuclease HII